MTRARVDAVAADPAAAAKLLQQAGRVLGFKPDLSSRLDRMRRTRHATFYEVDEVSAAMVQSALADAAAAIDSAKASV